MARAAGDQEVCHATARCGVRCSAKSYYCMFRKGIPIFLSVVYKQLHQSMYSLSFSFKFHLLFIHNFVSQFRPILKSVLVCLCFILTTFLIERWIFIPVFLQFLAGEKFPGHFQEWLPCRLQRGHVRRRPATCALADFVMISYSYIVMIGDYKKRVLNIYIAYNLQL